MLATVPVLRLASQTPSASKPVERTLALSVIVVASADEARRIVERLNRGGSFADLAKTESIDTGAGNGGLLGRVDISTLRPELRDPLESLKPGEISSIVPLPTGYAIFQVDADDAIGGTVGAATVGRALAATGSVKFVYNVSGLSEAEATLAQFTKPAGWNQDPRTICDVRRRSMVSMRSALEDFLSPVTGGASRPPFDILQAHLALAGYHSYYGAMDRAIDQYESASRVAWSKVPAATLQLEEALGIAHLHKSEMDNGAYRAPGELCLLPVPPGRAFAKSRDSQKAVEYFLRYLRQKPDDLEVRWLLNLAYMTLGQYPQRVPPPYLIPPSAFASAEDVGRFHDVAPQAGLNVFATAGGVVVEDLENNGRFDVVTSNFDSCGPMHFFRNNGDGTFSDRTTQADLGDQLGGLNLLQADYNNDGCADLLVLRGGWEIAQRKSLLRNKCDGTFTDVTAASGLANAVTSTQTAVWTDINNDGFLDLFVGNENGPAQLFLNKGNGTFDDIAAAAGVNRVAFTKGVTSADYDNDGFPDLYVSNFNRANFLYRNNHNNTFTEVAQTAGAPGPGVGFATWFFDYDNDGWPDIFATSYFTSLDEVARTYLRLPNNATTLKLYKNLRNGSFRDVTAEVGLNKVFMPMGANFGDIDNDGFLDIYLGGGNPSYASLTPHVLLRNKDGNSFVDVTASSGTGEIHKGHGIAFADLDNDGDEDIIAEIGGATPGDAHALRLFENPGHGNDWINLKLVGVRTNRGAIGARITVIVDNEAGGTRAIYRTVGSGGSFGASPLEQHIGLGKSRRIVDIEIWWPTSHTRQHFAQVGKNQALQVTEFVQEYTRLERPRLRLGGSKRK